MEAVGAVLFISLGVISMIVIAVLWIFALMQVAKAEIDPTAKAVWVLIILVAPVIGAIAWFAIGSKSRTLQ